MDFSLDVLYIGDNGKIKNIRTAKAPNNIIEYYLMYESITEDGVFVLEMKEGWSEKNNISEGDCIEGLEKLRKDNLTLFSYLSNYL